MQVQTSLSLVLSLYANDKKKRLKQITVNSSFTYFYMAF